MKHNSTAIPAYHRKTGPPGIRNHQLIIPVSVCAEIAAAKIGKKIPRSVVIPNQYGCSQKGDDIEQTKRVLCGLADNPNTGSVLLIALGCEKIDIEEIYDRIRPSGRPVRKIVIQQEGGTTASVKKGIKFARELKEKMSDKPDAVLKLSDICIGLECGASDIWTGITANSVAAEVSDYIVKRNGTVILSETAELIGAEEILCSRAVSPEVAARISGIFRECEKNAANMGIDLKKTGLSGRNKQSGLSTLKEKSLERMRKCGSSPVNGVFKYAETPLEKGLVIMDTPANDVQSMVGMAAGGTHVILFTTGKGTPAGNPVAPVIKICSTTQIFEKMKEHIDFNAGIILDGQKTPEDSSLEDVAENLIGLLKNILKGKKTASEKLGHIEFGISRTGPTF